MPLNKCLDCQKEISQYAKRCKSCSNVVKQTGKKWTKEHHENCRKASLDRRKKGDGSQTYNAVHKWIKKLYKEEKKCDFCLTTENRRYEYALKHGSQYIKRRENFFLLCVPCHRRYDGNMPVNRYMRRKLELKEH